MVSSHHEVWLQAWLAVATAQSTKEYHVAQQWADRCLEDFKKRFPHAFDVPELPY